MITLDFSQVFTSSKINNAEVMSGFSTKVVGDARDVSTIQYFCKQYNRAYNVLVRPNQTHSTNVSVVQQLQNNGIHAIENVDGLVTKEKNVMLTIITGDCVPLIFADRKNSIIGISHQGWKGTLGRMAQKMVEKMCEYGAEKKYINVAIGPAIGACCYEVYGERYEMFVKEFASMNRLSSLSLSQHKIGDLQIDTRYQFIQKRNNKIYLNLSFLNYLQLVELGITQKNIDSRIFCTHCNEHQFFSYKRDYGTEKWGEMFHYIMQV